MWFVSSEFKWLWIVLEIGIFHFVGIVEVNLFDEDGGLTFVGWGGGNFIKCLKRGWNGKKDRKTKF